jgi:DNA invertase Pin-like site-specific DNA recombinase
MKPLIDSLRAAIYARVSSDQQVEAGTIASQVAALEERLRGDGLALDPELRFIDEGYSGSTLVRPALERLGCDGQRRDRSPLRSLSRSPGSPIRLSSPAGR